MSQQKYLPIAVLITVAVAVIMVGLIFSLFSWLRMGGSVRLDGQVFGRDIDATWDVFGFKDDPEGDWNVYFVSDRNLKACRLSLDGAVQNLGEVRVNAPSVPLWATHYSISSNNVDANQKIEFGQNMDSSSFDRTIPRPKTIRLDCDEGYSEWKAIEN